jgi:hypothetical protein
VSVPVVSTVPPGHTLPYAWDEPTFSRRLHLALPEVRSRRSNAGTELALPLLRCPLLR